jgi:hypothetical protein
MDRTLEIIDELEALAATISNVSTFSFFIFKIKLFSVVTLYYIRVNPPPLYKRHYMMFILDKKRKIRSFFVT